MRKYNINQENADNIINLERHIKFLQTPKAHQKLIPFKELANRLPIKISQISKYVQTIYDVNKQTIKENFDNIVTIDKKVSLVQF